MTFSLSRLTHLLAVAGMALLGLCSIASTRAQAQVVIGNDDSNNVFPFGTSAYVGEYQQAYTSSAFTGPVVITQIAFSSLGGFGNTPITDNLSIALSTTSASLGALSSNYATNKGPDFTTVFSGVKTLVPLNNNTFDLVFDITPFTYDPSLGNLLLDVVITSNIGGSLVMHAGTGSSDTSRVFNNAGSGAPTVNTGGGLLTQITFRPAATVVPEPGTMALLAGLGVSGLMAVRRMRRNR